jgi:hypothetical protein
LSNGEGGNIHGRIYSLYGILPLRTNYLCRYGTIYLLLQLVPILSMFFLLTAAVSSALWAADLETERRQQEARAEAPQYTDEPTDDPV